eukprot:5702614-Pyramimonas_sp.AAC.1
MRRRKREEEEYDAEKERNGQPYARLRCYVMRCYDKCAMLCDATQCYALFMFYCAGGRTVPRLQVTILALTAQ